MKRSEFDELFPKLLGRCSEEMNEEISKLPQTTSVEELCAFTGTLISLSYTKAAQLMYDTVVNLGILEED